MILFFLVSCNSGDSGKNSYEPTFTDQGPGKKILLFGVPTPAFYESTNLMVKFLNKHLDSVEVRVVACINFLDYQDKLKANYFDFTMINGILAKHAWEHGYQIAGKMGDDKNYKGVILVHRDSSIRHISDLKGKTISFPGSAALAGTMMPLLFLYKNGLDVNNNITRLNVASYESSLMNVYIGKSSAGTCSFAVWLQFAASRPEIAAKLKILTETSSIPNSAILFREDMPAAIKEDLKKLFLDMDKSAEGKESLSQFGISRFENADKDTYKPLENFLKEYNRVIR